MRSEIIGNALLLLWAVIAISVLLWMGPIEQDVLYHEFSDENTLLSVPNALNVVSNLPSLVIGIWGIWLLIKNDALVICEKNRIAYYVLFISVSLVAIGSGYYHLWPGNETLVWDRLPMTVAFMGLTSIVVSEHVSETLGRKLLFPFLLLGLSSVVYWHYTEIGGAGDLRPYVFVQFFPIVGIPIVLKIYKSMYSRVSCYWLLLVAYLVAKIFEYFDYQVHSVLSVISGHSIKHIAAACGIWMLLRGYRYREHLAR